MICDVVVVVVVVVVRVTDGQQVCRFVGTLYGISEVSHGDAESEGNADPKT